jgi:hypothetical protein
VLRRPHRVFMFAMLLVDDCHRHGTYEVSIPIVTRHMTDHNLDSEGMKKTPKSCLSFTTSNISTKLNSQKFNLLLFLHGWNSCS